MKLLCCCLISIFHANEVAGRKTFLNVYVYLTNCSKSDTLQMVHSSQNKHLSIPNIKLLIINILLLLSVNDLSVPHNSQRFWILRKVAWNNRKTQADTTKMTEFIKTLNTLPSYSID